MLVQKILIVDDSPTMRQLLVFALKRLRGVEIAEAAHGADALQRLGAETFALVFTDINMPVMDGLKLIGMLRNNPASQDLPVVVITTEGAETDRRRALALGATEFISKPVQSAQVLDVARRLLGLQHH